MHVKKGFVILMTFVLLGCSKKNETVNQTVHSGTKQEEASVSSESDEGTEIKEDIATDAVSDNYPMEEEPEKSEEYEKDSWEWYVFETLESIENLNFTNSMTSQCMEKIEEIFPAMYNIHNEDSEIQFTDEELSELMSASAVVFSYFYKYYDTDTTGYALGEEGLKASYTLWNGDVESYRKSITKVKEIGNAIGLKMDTYYIKNKISAGQYKVGKDMPSGEYVLFAENGSGYFGVCSDANGSNILFNNNFTYNSFITVKEGEYVELSRCYAVNLMENGEIQIDTSGAGMFRVGIDVLPGEYKLVSEGDYGYYCIYNDSRHGTIVANDNFTGQSYVKVREGEYIELSRCKIEE